MKKIIFLSLTVFFVLGCGSKKPVFLKLNHTDKNLTYRSSIIQDIDTKAMGMSQNQKSTQIVDYNYELLKKLPDNSTDYKVKIMRVKIDQSTADGGLKFDTDTDEPKNQQERIYAGLKGAIMRMKIDENGLISDFSGADKMLDKMFEELPGSQLETLKKTMKAQFGNAAYQEIMQDFISFYPDKAVTVGDTWERSIKRSAAVGMDIKTTYTLTKRSKGKMYIDLKGVISPNADSKGLDMGMMKIQYSLSGTQSGSMIVDEATGWVDRNEVVQNFSGPMEITSPELPMGSMTAEMEAQSNILLERID